MSYEMTWPQVKRSLVERGLWTEEGDSRRARARLCVKCAAPVMAGLDDDRTALLAVCDPTPLNAMGEAAALLQRRATYSLRWSGGRYLLGHRDQFTIPARPAGSDISEEILAEHQCNSPMDARFHTTTPSKVGPRTVKETRSDPDF